MTLELDVINSVLKDKDISVLFAESSDDLFVAYGDVWSSIKDYYSTYRSVPDFEVIQSKFSDLEYVETKAETQFYLEQLKSEFISNRIESILTTAGKKLSPDSANEVLDKLQINLAKLNRFSHSARDANIVDFDEAERYYEEVRERTEALGGVPGLPTGLSFIDSAYTSGLSGGDLVIVLGWTGRGKSLLTTMVSCNAWVAGRKPMIVSLEMSAAKVRDRVYTILGNGLFRQSELMLGAVRTDDFRTFKSKHKGKQEFVVITNDGVRELTPNVVQAKIDQHKPDVLVLDYAQLLTDNANSSDMTARMRNMSKEYKRLAVQNNIPVILISSATPSDGKVSDGPPTIEQVAWSKQLAYDADLAFAVHKYDDCNLIEVVCRKNRNGPLFAGILDWDIDRGVFQEKFDMT